MSSAALTEVPPAEAALIVRDRVCRHIDGLAIGSTVAALADRGVLAYLMDRDRVTIGELRARYAANPGFLHVAVRLLADQGWVECSGEFGTDRLDVAATDQGRVAAGFAAAYQRASMLPRTALRLGDLFARQSRDAAVERAFAAALDEARAEWAVDRSLRPVGTRLQILAHLDGHLFAPVMAQLARHGDFGPERIPQLGRGGAVRRLVLDLLALAGWVTPGDDEGLLTAEGRIAARYAPQYWYPVGYLPLFAQVPELVFGDPDRDRYALGPAPETHVDRELDIRFSGAVFAGVLRDRFLEVALAPFDREPLEAQPGSVVDTGCGDGTVLAEFYRAIRERTVRGANLDRRPLLAVGIEPSEAARRVAAARLAEDGVPHLMLDGDIGDPQGLVRMLAEHGVDADDALHITKSVLHNRRHKGATVGRTDAALPDFAGAYAAPDGSALTPGEVADDLAALLHAWRGAIRRHGMVVVEAHCADPALTASLAGRSIHTAQDATHGYSCQYPITPDAFAWAATAAGLRSAAHREIGAQSYGHVVLTVDHFVTTEDTEGGRHGD
jgi:SAM-dependent methyltransferase